jgi:hypothetical protein
MNIFRRWKEQDVPTARLDRAEKVARDHARRLKRLELEVGIVRPSPLIRKRAQ